MKIGLTGSIAMGKSRTAQMFRDIGFPVFDADKTVHKLYQNGGKAAQVLGARFPAIISDGAIDRQKLMKEINAGRIELSQIEERVHPLVRAEQTKFYKTTVSRRQPIVVFDVPLIFETNTETNFDKIIVVSAPLETQAERALAREGMTREKLEFIRSQQVPDDEKRKKADFVIDTSVSILDTLEHVEKLAANLSSDTMD